VILRNRIGWLIGDGRLDLVTLASDQCLVMLQTAPGLFAAPRPLR
jgi:hypothetical protein